MINRLIFEEAKDALTQFRALCIAGPRQSGKTTLSKQLFKDKPYITFENPEVMQEAIKSPSAFLKKYKGGAVFDEIQRVPILFNYLQEILDNNTKRGQYILTGSNNFLLQEQISQSLAGRAGYLSLLPLSYAELVNAKQAKDDVHYHILYGGYPEIWKEKLKPNIWHNSYLQTYLHRDVRLLKNISNLAAFNRFIVLCANHAGQIVNRDELAKQTGVDSKTILSWLGLLENSYIIYQLQPWYNNLNKRVIKSPKLYFYDTGLLCYLLNIKSTNTLKQHNAYGAIYENWCITEIRKNNFNNAINNGMFYFRDSGGNEVDLIEEKNEMLHAVEIKAGGKLNSEMFKGLKYWKKYQGKSILTLLYGGKVNEVRFENMEALSWKEIIKL